MWVRESFNSDRDFGVSSHTFWFRSELLEWVRESFDLDRYFGARSAIFFLISFFLLNSTKYQNYGAPHMTCGGKSKSCAQFRLLILGLHYCNKTLWIPVYLFNGCVFFCIGTERTMYLQCNTGLHIMTSAHSLSWNDANAQMIFELIWLIETIILLRWFFLKKNQQWIFIKSSSLMNASITNISFASNFLEIKNTTK